MTTRTRTRSESARPTTRRIVGVLVAVLLVVVAVIAVAPGRQPSATGSPVARSPVTASSPADAPPGVLPREDRAAVDEADGVLPDGVGVFDDGFPGVANLDPALLGALRRAAADAGVPFTVTSGWRSPEYQDQLLREAVAEHGSEEEAARWVATADTSAHVSGDAVDVGPAQAMAWLAEHGAEHGLCRVYSNEPWHYELRPGAVGHGCPRPYADPTQDPRTHR
ncbi:D-alanyl-D-alanine carboxypeptidase [Geodermatophilus aquaeductus]|uniref:D-alanyl-D-alanine carboxypeptidase n=1 Tax=Geodermatophilus aquaeductus TaxID=1564161 RepID=A0A521FL14_9ACTN|nr:M15 family metallopeptidase [Geodermatophilus aquaeductus]SMO96912.1 D-alanyl-D-alanine carboxypeptidase [Geodermatophilus aquaeductus]